MALTALDGTPLPAHTFTPDPIATGNPDAPGAICMAVLQTSTLAEHGYNQTAQCGHPRSEH